MTRSWFLNLDAELEWAAGPTYSPTKRTLGILETRASGCRGLTTTDPFFFGHEPTEVVRETAMGPLVPWAVTWRAARFAARVGRPFVALVSPEVARTLASRRHVIDIDDGGGARRFLADERTLAEFLEERGSNGGRLRVKREFSSQGRHQRVMDAPLSAEDESYLRQSFLEGGLLVEPDLAVVAEYSLHGILLGEYAHFGAPCELFTDHRGVPLSVERSERLGSEERRRMFGIGERVAEALGALGHQGPFGIDFLVGFEVAGETPRLRLSEVNPRFTLGWASGMAAAVGPLLDEYAERALAGEASPPARSIRSRFP